MGYERFWSLELSSTELVVILRSIHMYETKYGETAVSKCIEAKIVKKLDG